MKTLILAAPLTLFCCAAMPALADTVAYNVVVVTSSQAGNSGYIDLELNKGSFNADNITAVITNFGGATLNAADGNNDRIAVTGMLPGALSFNNQSANDYFESLTFGSSLHFTATLSGPGVSLSGGAGSSSGTGLQLSFLNSELSSYLFTPDQSQFVVAEIDVDPSGTVGVTAQSGTTVSLAVVQTPEPETLSLVGTAVALAGAVRLRFGKRRS